jgi:hypothetical protein
VTEPRALFEVVPQVVRNDLWRKVLKIMTLAIEDVLATESLEYD